MLIVSKTTENDTIIILY